MGYAKWIGGGLGWAFGGPLGALLGYAFGSMIENFKVEAASGMNSTHPGDFAASLLALSAHIIKADEKVLESEIQYVQKFFERQFGHEHSEYYMLALRQMIERDFSIRDITQQIQQYMDYSSRVQLLHYLFGIARADGDVAHVEVKVIFDIAMDMGISTGDFESIQAMFYKDTASAYKVLEVSPDASPDEIKKAYRSMAVKFHPDKVAHLGDEFQKAAHEKFQKINEAYDTIKKEKGLQ